ncbi:MAG: PepSY-like domain-containing protein [Segetibacter sp.]
MLQKWMFSFVFLLAVLSVNAQFRKIPAVVTDAFKAKYASASGLEWKDKLTSFEADFKSGGKDMRAFFTSKGEWTKTETENTFNSLPVEVKDGFKKSKYADLSVLSVMQVEDKEKGFLYKIAVKKNDYNKRNLVFSASGQLVSDNGSII